MDLAKRTIGPVLGEDSVAVNVLHDSKLTFWQYREVHGVNLLRPCFYLSV